MPSLRHHSTIVCTRRRAAPTSMFRVSKHIHNPSTGCGRASRGGLKLQHDDFLASEDCVAVSPPATPVRSVIRPAGSRTTLRHDIKPCRSVNPCPRTASPVGSTTQVLRGRWPDVVCVHQTSRLGAHAWDAYLSARRLLQRLLASGGPADPRCEFSNSGGSSPTTFRQSSSFTPHQRI